jgi:hypothetical protein
MTDNTVLSKGRNAVDRVPSRATWPPPWLAQEQPPAASVVTAAVASIATHPEAGLNAAETEMPADALWDSAIPIEEVAPCPKCGSLELWWDVLDRPHCVHCQPPRPDCPALKAQAARCTARAILLHRSVAERPS